MPHYVTALLLILCAAVPAAADEEAKPAPAKPLTIEQTAELISAAHEAGDRKQLTALAAGRSVDPWLVADALLARDRADAAAAYAAVARGKDFEALAAYVKRWRDRGADKEARALLAAGRAAAKRRDLPALLAALERVPLSATPVVRVRAALGRASVHQALGDLRASSAAGLEVAELTNQIGWLNEASGSSQRAAFAAFREGDLRTARRIWRFRLDIERRRESRAGEAAALGNLGLTHQRLGNLPKALDNLTRASVMHEELRFTQGLAFGLVNIGILHRQLGDLAQALAVHERARRMLTELRHERGLAVVAANLAATYLQMGDYDQAQPFYEEGLRLAEKSGDTDLLATLMINAATLVMLRKDYDGAMGLLARGRKILEAAGATGVMGKVDSILGELHLAKGENEASVAAYERAIAHARKNREPHIAATARSGMTEPLYRLGRVDEAKAALERAIREGEHLRAADVLVSAFAMQAWIQRAEGQPRAAINSARRAVPHFERLVRGQSQEHGARIRELYANVYDRGALAAVDANDVAEACFFLETGRAGTLLEAMGGRTSLQSATLPDELIESEALARRAELAAQAAYEKALETKVFKAVRAASEALSAARAKVKHVITEIQRHEKQHTTAVLYPTASTLEDIQDLLTPDEAYVTFGLFNEGAVALVITSKAAHVTTLGRTAKIDALCAELDFAATDSDPGAALAALRKHVVVPLNLKPETKRVLLSPSGALSYVPAALLFEGREVSSQPSATTYALLSDERPRPGTAVLALGDPVYDSKAQAEGTGAVRRGRKLTPLPSTRIEVKAIGDVVLLGPLATRAGLEAALAKQTSRWRAIHFACHGLVDRDDPRLSSLALTPTANDTGFLTALDVFRMMIPADLAVLSACETGKGKVVQGEGLIGLTRAFMFAGAPRVVCSLWKVDDEATRALMIKFYELWHPKDGRQGVGAAAALRQAQAFIRSQDKWKHPYYWAAWVLWGLPQ